MKVTITKIVKTSREVNISAETQMAVEAFIKVLRAEKHLEKRERELERYVTRVPIDEVLSYAQITENIANNYEK